MSIAAWFARHICAPHPSERIPVPAVRFVVVYADGVDITPGEERTIGASTSLLACEHLEDAYDFCERQQSRVEADYGPGHLCVVDLFRGARVMMIWSHHQQIYA